MKHFDRMFGWLLIAPAILPVVIWGGLIYPYLVPKTLLFYAISLAAAIIFVVLVASGRAFAWRRLRRWEAWVPGALLVLAYIASIFGIDFYRSFWSIFVRGDGLFMLTCAVVDFYLILVSSDERFFVRITRAVALVAIFVAIYGIGEWFLFGGRIGSLLGNAAFFAGYLGIAFFATLAAAQGLSGWWRRATCAGAALELVAIVLTATRGTVLAFGVAVVAYLIYFSLRGQGRRRTWSASTLVALFVLAVAFFGFRTELAKVPFEPVARIASVSVADPDVASRLFIWKHMVTEIEQAPWLGVGAEHIDVLFNRFYDPTQIEEQWFDRSHNAFLDYAAQYGIGGLLLYLALIVSFWTSSVRLARRGEGDYAIFAALLAVVYAVQNFFVFDTISSFWLFLALAAVFAARSYGDEPRTPLPLPSWARYIIPLFAFLVIPISVRPAIAAYDLAHAYRYQLTDVSKETDYLSHGFALGTYGNLEYGYTVYEMYTGTQVAQLSGQNRVDAYHAALSILTTNFNRYPYDARTALYLAHVLTLAPQGTMVDSNLLSAALERVMRLSPKRYQAWYILVNLSLSDANAYPAGSSGRLAGYAAAKDLIERYIVLVPTLSTPHFVLAELDLATGDKAAAAAEAAKGKEYYTSDLEAASRAAVYYENILDLPDAAFFLSEVVQLDPLNAAAKADLEKIQAYEQSKQ